MNRLPRISVVVPCFNAEAYVADTLQSVVDQDYPGLNLIVVDAASTDGTLEVVKRFAGRIDRIVSEPDRGQSDGINKGMKLADGDVVTWLNADDMLAPGALMAVAQEFARDPSVEVLCGDAVLTEVDGSGEGWPVRPEGKPDFGWLLGYFAGRYLPQPSVFVRRDVWEAAGGVDRGLHYAMDVDLWIRIAATRRISRVGVTLARIRLHATCKTLRCRRPFLAEVRSTLLRHAGSLPPADAARFRGRIRRDFCFRLTNDALNQRPTKRLGHVLSELAFLFRCDPAAASAAVPLTLFRRAGAALRRRIA